MPVYRNVQGDLCFGGVDLGEFLEGPDVSTPSYVYDLDAMATTARELRDAFGAISHLVAYAVKANESGPVLRTFANSGCGADVVSSAELDLALLCGFSPDTIVWSGVAKTDEEIRQALSAGESGIRAIHVESLEELPRIHAIAKADARLARITLRINPEADASELATHAHIATGHEGAKFGIVQEDLAEALDIVGRSPNLQLVGLSTHVGSQLESVSAYARAGEQLFELAANLRRTGVGRNLLYVDTGGGFGIDYKQGLPLPAGAFVRALEPAWHAAHLDGLTWMVEPGRSLTGPHGILIAKVIQTKRTRGTPWLFIDAGMNDLIRPALYGARHRVVAVSSGPDEGVSTWRVAGPVCESSDDFGEHPLPASPPSHVAILDAGAYGVSMASRYNARMAPSEIFLSNGQATAIIPPGDRAEWVARQLAG